MMRQFPATPLEMFASFWRNRGLIKALTKREILGRYRGSVMGLLWSLFNPLFMLAVYTFVFSVVFKARWNVENNSKVEFALVLFAGLIIFNLFAECITRAPGLILSNTNYVKRVVFPLEVFPVVQLLTALFHAFISLSVWMFAYIVFFGIPHSTLLCLPLIILPFMLFIIGLSWALASLGVFLRDVSQMVAIIITVLMFLSPLFYPVSALPEAYRRFLYLNPLTIIIEQTRAVLYWGSLPDLKFLIFYWISTLIVAWIGFFWFQKTRKGFADVL